MERVRRKCGFLFGIDVVAEGSRSGLSFGWKPDWVVELQSYSRSHNDVIIRESVEVVWRFTCFNGILEDCGRSDAWDLLRHLGSDQSLPWLGTSMRLRTCLKSEEGDFVQNETWEVLFRFDANWVRDEEVEQIVKSCWDLHDESIHGKLQRVGQNLLSWSRSNKRSYTERKQYCRLGCVSCQQLILNMEADKEELFWEQRARANWLRHGDMSTSFFHNYATYRRKNNTIVGLFDTYDTWIMDPIELISVADSYFKELFQSSNLGVVSPIFNEIEPRVTDEMNESLLLPFRAEEVWQAIKGMAPLKASGLDMFPTVFYQKYWHVIDDDITSYCLSFLNETTDLEPINNTHIVLIPKVNQPVNMTQSRPISLCNVLYKIVAKRLRFAGRWVRLIMKCVRTITYSIGLNEITCSPFRPSCGLRKGEPLSLYLFLVCAEGLSALFNAASRDKIINGATVGWERLRIGHLLFADDIVLFGEDTPMGAINMKKLLHVSDTFSRQRINFDNSLLFFSSNVEEGVKEHIGRVLGVRISTNPERYFGLPTMNDPWLHGYGDGKVRPRNIDIRYTMVSDHIDASTHAWKYEVLRDLFDDEQVSSICSIPLSKVGMGDVLVWRPDGSGQYIVKSGYRLLQTAQTTGQGGSLDAQAMGVSKFYKEMWVVALPAKVKITVWRIVNNFVSTFDNLQQRRLYVNNVCCFYQFSPETIDHLMRDFTNVLPFPVYATPGGVDAYIREIGCFAAPIDSALTRNQAIWQAPGEGMVKFNFDSAYHAQSMEAVSGVIGRDSTGCVLVSCTVPHTFVKDAFVVEALSCFQAVTFALELGFRRVISEGDSLTVIKKLRCPIVDGSFIAPVICEINEISKAFECVSFSFVGRIANNVAHLLAREGWMHSEQRFWVEEASPGASVAAE
ncbi:hypothetical protein F3Y22_tig00111069pilonHSYRG00104 [Hibiscus syriacus]|uniref:RNase H type-1 domain-containing protein n=1 Tax=Hibiscus syriacus TaxID=106335 RepID=A0A6A2Z3U4_HIBSY|nr:hypothetical protein F3Y22_tig00111069pilonHSYRG00104 [Hibiscus syriacus]